MAVQFFFTDRQITLTERTGLKSFIEKIFKKEKRSLTSLTCIFCSDDYLLSINRQFLQHDYYTDIITFDLSATKKSVEGEIYISIDRIKENARNNHVTIKEEIHRVIFHGVLHLCGYKDKSLNDIKKMREGEERCLKLYFK